MIKGTIAFILIMGGFLLLCADCPELTPFIWSKVAGAAAILIGLLFVPAKYKGDRG